MPAAPALLCKVHTESKRSVDSEPSEGAQISALFYMELVCVNFGFRLVCMHAHTVLD